MKNEQINKSLKLNPDLNLNVGDEIEYKIEAIKNSAVYATNVVGQVLTLVILSNIFKKLLKR